MRLDLIGCDTHWLELGPAKLISVKKGREQQEKRRGDITGGARRWP